MGYTDIEGLLCHGGDAGAAPAWREDDYDSIYVVRIERTHEGLNGQLRTFPG